MVKNKEIEKKKLHKTKEQIKRFYEEKIWWTIRATLGNYWANWFILLGARQRGKTFSVQEYVLKCYFNPKHPLYLVPFYWMRLNDITLKAMMMNNGAKMFEPLLVDRFPALKTMKVSGDSVFWIDENGKKHLLCYCWGLSTAYNLKGSAIFNQDTFKGCNIIIDEVALEKGQKKTFDFAYNLKTQIENVCRNKRDNVKVFMMLNNTAECPDILSMFCFLPTEFGVYKLKKKHCLIAYIPNTAGYEEMRKEALANELDTGTGNFTNKIERDLKLIYKKRLIKPSYILKFSKDKTDWYTVWDGKVICPYNNEKKIGYAMKRYIDETYNVDLVNNIIEMIDARAFNFKDLFIQTKFYADLQLIKK